MLGFQQLMQIHQLSLYKITVDHSVAVGQKKNDHIQLYTVIMKVKNKLFYMKRLIVDYLWISRGQANVLVKCLGVVLVSRLLYKNRL